MKKLPVLFVLRLRMCGGVCVCLLAHMSVCLSHRVSG